MVTTKLKFSSYQEAIFKHTEESNKPLVVKAVAGAGKTTTLIEIAKRMGGNKLFCAFNKHIADELKKRLRGVTVRTIHSLGMKTLGKVEINSKKYWQIAREFLREKRIYGKQAELALPFLKDLTLLGMANLAKGSEVLSLMTMNPLGNVNLVVEGYEFICRRGVEVYEQKNEIDFIDMIWLPNRLSLLDKLDKYDGVMVDETQDLNRAQVEIVIASLADGGKIVAVGDPAQSIYGFAGADPQSMERMIQRLSADVLPLSVCYRCPTSHITLAQEFNPVIEPGKREEGEIFTFSRDEYVSKSKPGDLIICRRTSPLIEVALALLSNRKACRIRGRDIGKDIKNILSDTQPKPWTIGAHIMAVEERLRDEISQLDQQEDKETIAELKDKFICISVLLANSGCNSITELFDLLERLFSDDEEESIWLSTIHRAKGLEADTVVLLNRSRMPDEMATTPSELEQENNLLYVAHTRAKHTLIFIELNHK